MKTNKSLILNCSKLVGQLKTKLKSIPFYFHIDCMYAQLIGNNYCDDEANNFDCNYDGGDCCSSPELVGNGFCNSETNNISCSNDGGDCCGPDVACE